MVTVQVRDFDTMVTWYRDILGLAIGWFEPGEFCTLVSEDVEGAVLALATDHPERVGQHSGIGWTPTLLVDDFDATIARLKTWKVAFDGDEEGADEGYRLVRIKDPEGNALGLTA
jgi:catechol 2,3-dioxygenase-like lactoylglutathione lyase family enzyme